MKIRLYDEKQKSYLTTQVYAIVNTGIFKQFLVLIPSPEEDIFRLVKVIEKDTEGTYSSLINTIIRDNPQRWIRVKTGNVNRNIDGYIVEESSGLKFYEYYGFSEFFENKKIMNDLLGGNEIKVKGSEFESMIYYDRIDDWNYVETQNEASTFLDQVSGFHDSILKEMNYISGGYVNEDKSMHVSSDIRKVTMVFDSQMCQSFELVFEGVTAMNLRPGNEDYDACLCDGSIIIKDCTVFFCDTELNEIDLEYPGTWITSYSLRWRFI